ncbi:MAG: hypothetical protein U0795_05150 [Pirellulales bacterium]
MPVAVLLSQDLMLSSMLSGPAGRARWQLVSCRNWQAMTETIAQAPAAGRDVKLVVIDLTLSGLELKTELFDQLHSQSIATVAFGPHVHRERLAAALAAGCQRVWSRGQLHQQADELFAS